MFKINNATNKVKSKQKSFTMVAILFGNYFESLYAPNDVLNLHADAGNLLVCCLSVGLLFFGQFGYVLFVADWVLRVDMYLLYTSVTAVC